MAGDHARVMAVVRHREAVLLDRSSDSAFPTAPVAEGAAESALDSLVHELGLESPVVDRRGQPVETPAGEVIPFLVAVPRRDVNADGDWAWLPPVELRRRTDDHHWRRYRAVAPTVETVANDTERGSTAIATDALWVLRDAATRAVENDDGMASVEAVATELLDARPSMAALANRVNRAMAGAGTPTAVERAATEGIVRAFEADERAAAVAAETVDGKHVLTLSRSGTVRAALLEAGAEVEVLASRPGGEGLEVADELADAGVTVESFPDAVVYDRLRTGDVDAVLVGADAVTPDGDVVNKVGTRAAALAAEMAAVPFYVVCATDKVRPGGTDDAGILPYEPRFDLTPARLVTALLTERGSLAPADVPTIADEHRALASWEEADQAGVEKG